MMKSQQILILILTVLVVSCNSNSDKNDFKHDYLKYWDKYSEQSLKDTLFSDTLMVGPDTEGGWTCREFYIKKTEELLADLIDDKNEIDSLYPMTAFDELTIKKLPLGFKKTFTNEQTRKFLSIINDPVSFDWAETTYKPEYRVEFLKSNKTVATLTIGENKSVIKTEFDWTTFKKMKFGRLKPQLYKDFVQLIDDLN